MIENWASLANLSNKKNLLWTYCWLCSFATFLAATGQFYNSRSHLDPMESKIPSMEHLDPSFPTPFFTPLTWESVLLLKNYCLPVVGLVPRRREDGFWWCRIQKWNKKYTPGAPFLRYNRKVLNPRDPTFTSSNPLKNDLKVLDPRASRVNIHLSFYHNIMRWKKNLYKNFLRYRAKWL